MRNHPAFPDGFEATLAAYARLIGEAIRRSGIPLTHPERDDVEQEVRIGLWKAVGGEREIRNVPSFLYRVAANAAIDAVRRVKSRREEGLETEEGKGDGPVLVTSQAASPESLAAAAELRDRVGQALSSLEPSRRRAVALHLRGFTTQEIADLLRWTEPKARNLVYRGLAEVRQRLSEMGIEAEGP